jgi:predicted DNA-binding transcriptional regulator AlpA
MHDAVTAPARLLLTEEEAAHALGFTARFLQNRRHRGNSPPYCRISARAVRYRPEDLAEWAAKHLRTSTSDPGSEAA